MDAADMLNLVTTSKAGGAGCPMPAAVIFVPYAHDTYDVDTMEKMLAFDKDTFGTMLAEAIALKRLLSGPPRVTCCSRRRGSVALRTPMRLR